MSASYQPILWNRQKRMYDLVMAGLIIAYLGMFSALGILFYPDATAETIIIRATGTLAILLLHIILIIGPLARLNRVFLPLLYNRRHLGVTMFFVGAAHGVFSLIQFHALGNVNPLISLFTSNTHFESLTRFPFQVLGFFALVIFFMMAITSHDFWLHTLGPRFWKTLHMLVYVAYVLVILHVFLGILQYENSPVLFVMIIAGMVLVGGLHLATGHKERIADKSEVHPGKGTFVRVCKVNDLVEKRGKVISLKKERIAIFKYDGKISAVSNVCKHQHGPLGEGRIVDGCITCPWHGYQYLPHNGSSPPPFKEKVATYDVKIIGDEVWVNPTAYPDGTERPPALIK
ncbi:MAG: Rieske 2Fe-2S domain-containing protein [Bacteroidota bacterium]